MGAKFHHSTIHPVCGETRPLKPPGGCASGDKSGAAMCRLHEHRTSIHLLELLNGLILKQNTQRFTTLNTCWVYVWEQTANKTDGSECFPQIMEEALSSDPYRCKLSAVINKSKADIISSSAETQLVSARTLRTSAVIHRLCHFVLFYFRLLIYAVSFTSSFSVQRMCASAPFRWPRGALKSHHISLVFTAPFFASLMRCG